MSKGRVFIGFLLAVGFLAIQAYQSRRELVLKVSVPVSRVTVFILSNKAPRLAINLFNSLDGKRPGLEPNTCRNIAENWL
jgi:hypothetical protein